LFKPRSKIPPPVGSGFAERTVFHVESLFWKGALAMAKDHQTLVSVGDLLMECRCEAGFLFDGVREEISKATVALGQGESVLTNRGNPTYVDPFCTQIKGASPEYAKNMREAGFDVLTLCSNHIWDLGREGIEDTIAACDANGLLHTGAGMTLDEASRPAIMDVDNVKYGFIGYICTGPVGSWAQIDKPGCNYIHSVTAFEYAVPCIGGIPARYSYPLEEDLERMRKDILSLRPQVDVLSVSIHKGVGFIPAAISPHEFAIAHAAVDAGADVVFGHHGHILKGVEVYKGKAIFHDLSNFMAISEKDGAPFFRYGSKMEHRVQNDYTYEQKIAREKEFNRRNGGPFIWGPLGTPAPWPPREIVFSGIAKCYVSNGKIEKVSLVPCKFNDDGYINKIDRNTTDAEDYFAYLTNITRNAYMDTEYTWDDGEIRITVR
jgi:poly-gamma-glutamate synthesis protein (capsule biosynthesis protein)